MRVLLAAAVLVDSDKMKLIAALLLVAISNISSSIASEPVRCNSMQRLRGGQDGIGPDVHHSFTTHGPASPPAARGRGRGGRGAGRGRGGRGRGPASQVKAIDTVQLAAVYKNLTNWEEPELSRAVFVLGNGLFAALFFGRKAIFCLWFAFLAAFALPKRQELTEYIQDLQLQEVLENAREVVMGAAAVIRERLAAARGRGPYSGEF